MTIHPLVRHQLEKVGLHDVRPPNEAWASFLRDVSAVYYGVDHPLVPGDEPTVGRAARTANLEADTSSTGDKLRTVIGCLGEGLLVVDDELRVELINPRGAEILRTSAEDVVGRPLDELAQTWRLRDRGPYAVSKMRHHLVRGIPYRNEDAFVAAQDGEIIHVSLVMTPLTDAGEHVGAVISFRDVTTLKVAERALRESEQRFRHIFQEAPAGMIRVGRDGRLTEVNASFERLLGHEAGELDGVELTALLHPDDREHGASWLSDVFSMAGKRGVKEYRYVDRRGATVWTNTALAIVPGSAQQPDFAIGVVEDLTERKRLEVELRHAQKLEAVGILAAGIAHEINTPIQFIGDNVSFLGQAFDDMRLIVDGVEGLPGDVADNASYLVEEVPVAVQQTLEGVERVAKIVAAMKAFGYHETSAPVAADLNEAVMSTLVVAQSELKYVADVQTELGDLPPVTCFISDVNQVLLNLLVNAAHAIADVVGDSGSRGVIRVRTHVDGDDVVIAVSDSGCGIPEAIRDRIFEPFFTTKEVGRGTGQGLALVHAVIVERHGGGVSVESEQGVGTTFSVRIPLSRSNHGTGDDAMAIAPQVAGSAIRSH